MNWSMNWLSNETFLLQFQAQNSRKLKLHSRLSSDGHGHHMPSRQVTLQRLYKHRPHHKCSEPPATAVQEGHLLQRLCYGCVACEIACVDEELHS